MRITNSAAPDCIEDMMQLIIDLACAVTVSAIVYVMLRTSAALRAMRQAADELERKSRR